MEAVGRGCKANQEEKKKSFWRQGKSSPSILLSNYPISLRSSHHHTVRISRMRIYTSFTLRLLYFFKGDTRPTSVWLLIEGVGCYLWERLLLAPTAHYETQYTGYVNASSKVLVCVSEGQDHRRKIPIIKWVFDFGSHYENWDSCAKKVIYSGHMCMVLYCESMWPWIQTHSNNSWAFNHSSLWNRESWKLVFPLASSLGHRRIIKPTTDN